MKKYAQYDQGKFIPQHPEKYSGQTSITFRSSWERNFCIWCDRNPNCLKWGSESIVVTYVSPLDKKNHRYFIDFNATFNTKNGPKTYLIEIKPYRQTIEPKPSAKKKQMTYLKELATYHKNLAKWESAREYARRKGQEFIIITERELYKV